MKEILAPLGVTRIQVDPGLIATSLGAGVRNAGGLHALVRVGLRAGVDPDCFEAYLSTEAGIAEAWRLAGDCDFEVRLSCRSLADLDALGGPAPRGGRHHRHHPGPAPRPPGRVRSIWPLTAQPPLSVGGLGLGARLLTAQDGRPSAPT